MSTKAGATSTNNRADDLTLRSPVTGLIYGACNQRQLLEAGDGDDADDWRAGAAG